MFRSVSRSWKIFGPLIKTSALIRSSVQPSCILLRPAISICSLNRRPFSSQVDRQFSEILAEEIKQEAESAFNSRPPSGFHVTKCEGTEVFLEKTFPDGVIMEVEMDLAGSIAPEDIDEADEPAKESEGPLDARPEFKIRLKKPSGRTVVFHCSFPSKYAEDAGPGGEQQSKLRRFSVI
ncbi:Complement component 1 Q subcomponent-binding protein, mitochondrial [Sparganum proliferum]